MTEKRSFAWRPSPGTVLGALALIVATSGFAAAALPDGPDDGAVAACVSKGGAIRVIDPDSGEACSRGQTGVMLASVDASGKVADSDLLDGKDSTDFLGANGKATDSDLLDGKDSTDFLAVNGKATDSDRLDGKDSTDLLAVNGKAADSDNLDGKDSTWFQRRVAEACPEGSAISAILAGGGRVCEQFPSGLDYGAVKELFGYQVVSESFTIESAHTWLDTVYCPAGKRPLSGGILSNQSGNRMRIAQSYPNGNGWTFEAAHSVPGDLKGEAKVVCANV